MIADVFKKHGINDYRALGAENCTVVKPYLLRDFGSFSYAIFFLMPYYIAKHSNLASFAAVPDYHGFAASTAHDIDIYLREKYGKKAVGFADHSPFDERACALSCGLGILGDHGLLISEKHSSFVTIGEIVCTLDKDEIENEGIIVLEEKKEIKYCEHCGKCALACTAGATSDKSRCVSEISQKKGALSETERSIIKSSEYVWGCDLCQLACPHTEMALASGTLESNIEYFLRSHIGEMTEEKLASMSDEEYSTYTFSWRKKDVMLRNIRLKGERND